MVKKLLSKYRNTPVRARTAMWFFVCSFLQKGISTITTPIFTRLLTTTEYGQYNVFNSWFSILTVFVTVSLYCGVYPQRLIKYSEVRASYASSMQGLALTLCLAWTAVYLLFRNFWNGLFGLTTVQMLAMLAMIWTNTVFGLWSGEQRVECKYRCLVLITIFVLVAKPVLGIFFVLHAEDKVTARVLGLVIVEFVAYSAPLVSQLRRGKVFFSRKYWLSALALNIPLIPHYLSSSVLSGADRIMIKNMVSESAAGIYSLAYSISMVMTMFNTALVQTIEPWIYEKIKAKKVLDIPKVVYPALLVIAGLNILLIALAPEFVRVFAPPEYYEAIWVIPPVAMSVFFQFTYFMFVYFELYYEQTRLVSVSTMAAAALNIALNYVFIGWFGYVAAGYTTLLCYCAYGLLHYVGMRRVCRLYLESVRVYDWKVLVGITVGFLAIGFVFTAAYKVLWLRYTLLVGLAAVLLIKRDVLVRLLRPIMQTRT